MIDNNFETPVQVIALHDSDHIVDIALDCLEDPNDLIILPDLKSLSANVTISEYSIIAVEAMNRPTSWVEDALAIAKEVKSQMPTCVFILVLDSVGPSYFTTAMAAGIRFIFQSPLRPSQLKRIIDQTSLLKSVDQNAIPYNALNERTLLFSQDDEKDRSKKNQDVFQSLIHSAHDPGKLPWVITDGPSFNCKAIQALFYPSVLLCEEIDNAENIPLSSDAIVTVIRNIEQWSTKDQEQLVCAHKEKNTKTRFLILSPSAPEKMAKQKHLNPALYERVKKSTMKLPEIAASASFIPNLAQLFINVHTLHLSRPPALVRNGRHWLKANASKLNWLALWNVLSRAILDVGAEPKIIDAQCLSNSLLESIFAKYKDEITSHPKFIYEAEEDLDTAFKLLEQEFIE